MVHSTKIFTCVRMGLGDPTPAGALDSYRCICMCMIRIAEGAHVRREHRQADKTKGGQGGRGGGRRAQKQDASDENMNTTLEPKREKNVR